MIMASHTTENINGHPRFDARKALTELDIGIDALLGANQDVSIETLKSLYPKQVIVDEAEKETWRKGHFSAQQQAAKPALVFQPSYAKEVAAAVIICRATGVKFAVKSGGHAPMAGASSSDGGVSIDLRNFKNITLNEDKSLVSIGAGNIWEDVFDELAKHGKAVAGGRAGDVGVGGYTLGGGISFFASARGWACDNVRNYEVVTAAGEIINVNYESYPDLFWALRGGGPNFGIVTRFDYETFPQGDIYAGSLVIDYKHKDEIVPLFTSFAHDSDPKTATWLVAAYYEGRAFFSMLAMHADPTPEFEVLKAYAKVPALHQAHQIRSISDMTRSITAQNVPDHYQNYQNTTFKMDTDFVQWLVEMYMREIEPVQDSYESKQPIVMTMQYYTKESVALMRRQGGNCLPLKEDEAPYLNVLTPSAWLHEKDTELVMGIISKIHRLAREEGARRGLLVEYIYMNYGSHTQDVFKGYGKENYDRLEQIAKKYDPEAVFQKLMPGYYKFGGSPEQLGGWK